MRVERIEARSGPEPDRCRLEATVRYDDGATEGIWFEYPESFLPGLNRSGDPWLVALAPLALTTGEPLHLPASVDARLLQGVHQAANVWRSWYPELAPLDLHVPFEDRQPPGDGRHTGSLFSGGVDSWYTALVNPAEAAEGKTPRIDTLMLVRGADIRLQDVAALGTVQAAVQRAARHLGHEAVFVGSNLRETRWSRTDWTMLSHAAFFLALAHGSGRFRQMLIPSSVSYTFGAWGSHPLTDPLLSSSAMRVTYHAAEKYRFEKIGVIAQSQAALDELRVCWRSGNERNCGRCGKCLRTMIPLELYGALERCPAFPVRRLDPVTASRLFVNTPLRVTQLLHMRDYAGRIGRLDLKRALERARRRSRWISRVSPTLERLDRSGLRGAYTLRRWFERDLIRE